MTARDRGSRYSRRRVLKTLGGTATALGVAGCAGSGGGQTTGGSGGSTDSGGTETDGGGSSSGGGGGEDVSVTMASAFAENHILVRGSAKRFKEIVEDESGGRFTVQLAPGGSYGSSGEISELVSEGGVEAMSQGTFPFFQNASEYVFFAMPWVVDDHDQIEKLHESDLMAPAYEQIIDQGNQRPLGQMANRGGRMVYTKEKTGTVSTPDDTNGLPMRVPELPPWVDVWAKIGVEATPVSWVEIYSAFQTGTVDAVEAPTAAFDSKKLYEIADVVNVLRSGFSTGNIYFNEDFYQGLDETYQDLVQEAGDEATRHASELAESEEQEQLKKFEEKGMRINEDVDRQQFFDAAKPVVKRYFEESWAPSWDEAREYIAH